MMFFFLPKCFERATEPSGEVAAESFQYETPL